MTAMPELHVLTCTTNGANKFYIACDLSAMGKPEGFTAFGPNTGGTGGNWSNLTNAEVRKKLKEKQKEYSAASLNNIPAPAVNRLVQELKKATGVDFTVRNNRLERADAKSASPKTTDAKHKRALAKLHVWF